jgi:hypothetical protein
VNGPWAGTEEAMAVSRGGNIINKPKWHADKCTQSEFIPLFLNPRPCKQKFAKGFIIKVKKKRILPYLRSSKIYANFQEVIVKKIYIKFFIKC